MAGEQVFRVMLRMEIKPGLEEEFEELWVRIADAVTTHPANLDQWLSRSDEKGIYYIVSDWRDESGFRAFEKSDRHLRHRERLHPFRERGSMDTMHVVAHIDSRRLGFESHELWEAAG
ncbi:antibiotic biosynthesis monooxygenase family protein [Amycolatopsis japonica]